MMQKSHIKFIVLIALLFVAGGLFFASVQAAPPPHVQVQYDDTIINLSADKRWVLQSGGCINVSWKVDGITSIYIDGEGKIGEGVLEYCPVVNATSPMFEITDNDDVYRVFTLDIHYLPDFVFYLFGFLGLAFTVVYTIYQLLICRYDNPFPIVGMLSVMLVLAMIGGGLKLSTTPTEPINQQVDDVSVSYWAYHSLILFPDECVRVTWSVVGAAEILFNGDDVTVSENPAKDEHCPADGDVAVLTVIAEDGQEYVYSIAIPSLLPYVEGTTLFFYWSLIGLILAGVIYFPLIFEKIQQLRVSKQYHDGVVVVGFFVFLLLLYLPFGFQSIGHWEEWIINAYLEGKQADIISSEMVSRFWVIVPHTLAYILSSESFVGYHLVNFMMFWGKLVLLYGIFRHLNVSRFHSFCVTMLFMVYPVNSALMSLRSFPMEFSMVSLLGAVYLILDYRKTPSRLKLAGVWLGLLFNVTSNESAYGIILVIPLIWWLQDRKINWRNFNLTAIWYLYPAFKVAWLLFLSATDRNFYQSGIVNSAVGSSETAPDNVSIFTRVMQTIFENTLVTGWQDAFASFGDSGYVGVMVVMVLVVVGIGWWLSREQVSVPSITRTIGAIVAGTLFIIPSVGVLMWIPLYRNDPWRMYFYVPIGGAIVVFATLVLITRFIPQHRIRQGAILLFFGVLMIPATTRLLNQHDTFVTSSHNKAQVLRSIVEQAPEVSSSTYIILTTSMSNEQLQALEIFEFVRRDMLDSVFSVLYHDNPPRYAYFCLIDGTCSTTDTHLTLFYPIVQEVDYSDIVLFEVHEDLSVQLVQTLPVELGFPDDVTAYRPNELIDESGIIPMRARTMLRMPS